MADSFKSMNSLTKNQAQNKLPLAAQKYLDYGFSVIPVEADGKRPACVTWKPFQKRKPYAEELQQWFGQDPSQNIGIVCGSVSRLVVVDVDERNGGLDSVKQLHTPPTYMVRTPGGFHYYYRVAPELNVKKSSPLPGIDIQGEGSYVVAPPSKRSGAEYEALGDVQDIVEAPAWILAEAIGEKEKLWQQVERGVKEGSRNAVAASYTGKLFRETDQEDWEQQVWSELKRANQEKFSPPLGEAELRRVYESIRKLAEQDKESPTKQSSSSKLVSFVLDRDPTLFKTSHGEAYIQLNESDGGSVYPVYSSAFQHWLRHAYWQGKGKALPQLALSQTCDLLASIAIREGDTVELQNRVAETHDCFYYDLRDGEEQVVRIDKDGWSVATCKEPLFKTYAHQETQVYPEPGGDINLLFQYVNLADKDQQLLLKIYLVSAFIPAIPHPIPLIHGPHGSSKSTFMRVLRCIIDPSSLELLTFPRKPGELIQILDHHWCAFFDNVSKITPEESDELCKACTGGGMSKRRLYTDDEDVIYYFKRCIAINSISNVAYKPDLLSRSLMFKLDRIEKENRLEEKVFWGRFQEDLPKILGGVFDTLSKAMALYDQVQLRPTSRLADFERWGYAIAMALGYSERDFANAYQKSRDRQNEEALESNDIAYVLIQYLEGSGGVFDGEMQVLLQYLNNKAEELGVSTHTKYWPKNPAGLGRKLNEMLNNLLDAGYLVERSRGEKRTVCIKTPARLELEREQLATERQERQE